MVSFMAMTLIFASGVIALQLKPTWTETIDPLQTPYFGKFGGNAFLIRGKLNHTDGQRLTHRLALAIVGTLVLGFLLRPKIDLRCLVYQGCSLTMQWVFRNRWVGALLAVGLLVLEMPSFQKTPDFSLCNDKTMTAVHQHMTGVVGHGDRLAGGDVLFRDVTPLYGVLLPTILAVWERNLGLLAFGDVLRLMVALEMIYLVTAMYLFLTWSRMRWVWAAAALSLMLPYYYSESNCLIPQNHGIWRMCGIPLTVLSLWCLRSLGAVRSSWIAGMVCAIAILANIESGISSSAGVGVYLTLRFGTRDGRIVWTQVASFAWRVALAMLSTFGAFWAAYAILLGDFPDIRGVGEIWVYAQLGGSGFGSSPLKWVDLPRTGWPLLMFVHAAGTLTYTVWTGSYGHRGAFRASVAGIFLVWFSYFMNRPDPIYSCSFMFLYGFLLIDSLRLVTAAVWQPYRVDAAVATFAGVVIVIAGVGVSEVVDWTRNPLKWEVKSYRWSVPLVKRGETPGMPNAVRISKVYVNPQYAKLMTERANYLKAKAGDRKLIYFSPDSYLMLRLSGVFPKQEYIDVSEALTFRCYWRLYCFIVESHEPEIYFDARDESTLHWCGQQFRMLRQHLSSHYTLTRVESGWEVWTRK